MKEEILHLFAQRGYEDHAKLFYEKYDLKKFIVGGDDTYSKRNFRKSSERRCIFCKRSYSRSKFSNYSHLVPKLMGNTNLYSDFECDQCNTSFGKFEHHLANFLGISRTLSAMNDEKLPPSFVAKRLTAKSRSFIGSNILIIAPEDIHKDGEITQIKYLKNAFTPSTVYKALLKSSLSVLGHAEASQNYEYALKYLAGHYEINRGAFITGYNLSFQTNLPLSICLFERREPSQQIPKHTITFNFQNNIITVPIPLHKETISLEHNEYEIIKPPPFCSNQTVMESFLPMPFDRDLFSNQTIIDEQEIISFAIDAESLKNTAVYDPIKDEITTAAFQMGPIKYVIVMKEGTVVDPKVLSKFIRGNMDD